MGEVKDHYDAVASTYGEQYDVTLWGPMAENLPEYPANYFRLEILARRIAELRLNSVYEVGVGDGTALFHIQKMGCHVAGCDISEAMVDKAKTLVNAQLGDIEDVMSLRPSLNKSGYDAVIAAGVLPHVKNDRLAIQNMSMFLRAGGRLFLEFRNKVFSLFTFNRYTKEFILDDLLSGVREEVKAKVEGHLRFLSVGPLARIEGPDGSPGYDAILSKFHNPWDLADLVESCGFTVDHVHWYHYHPAPPLLEESIGPLFRKEAMAMEHEQSWRGLFLCSAGLIEATKATS